MVLHNGQPLVAHASMSGSGDYGLTDRRNHRAAAEAASTRAQASFDAVSEKLSALGIVVGPTVLGGIDRDLSDLRRSADAAGLELRAEIACLAARLEGAREGRQEAVEREFELRAAAVAAVQELQRRYGRRPLPPKVLEMVEVFSK